MRPTPRSHTSARTSSRARTWAKVTLAFSGNMRSTSILAPRRAASTRREIGDEEHGVRVAHVDNGSGAQLRRTLAIGPQVDPPRVGDRVPKRDRVPVEARRAHVDPIGPGPEPLAGDQSGFGLDRDPIQPELAAQPVGDAARAIAAGAGERAVVVVDHDVGGGSRRPRIAENHHLIVAEAFARDGSRARLPARGARANRACRAREWRCRPRSCAR